MATLAPNARAELQAAGITVGQWIVYGGWFEVDENGVRRPQAETWHGDRCGCTDDRCIGHHHDADEDCGCLPVLIEEFTKTREAHRIWTAYRAAVEANDGRSDEAAYEAAWASADVWIRLYYPHALTFSLDATVNGKRGISAAFPPLHDGTIPTWAGVVPEGEGYRMLVYTEGNGLDDARAAARAAIAESTLEPTAESTAPALSGDQAIEELTAKLHRHAEEHQRAAAAVRAAWPTRDGYPALPADTDTITVRMQTEQLYELEKDLTGRGVAEDLVRLGFLVLHRQQPQPYGTWAENCAAAYAAVLDYDRNEDAR